ncbi:ABC transporter ATP-binding protein/permease [Micrococcus luteus]|uniref:ATP-binding cassette domain-containing protein n=1 Tax=Micrococcus luteus TaxID=1270 RepID=UPI002107F4C9|nr:ABC transporter ATP-binding protein [Micrococcus luteus]UTX34836.1 ABC transporter ATP-binding protein/permease [Micrococcus luteus]
MSARAFTALLPALRGERAGMLHCYAVGTASALALAGLSVLSAWGLGAAVTRHEAPPAWWWSAVIVLVLARAVLTWREMDVSHALAYRVLARLRMALFDSYARSVPGRRGEHSGRAAGTAMEDIEHLEFFYAHTVAQLATSATVLVAAVVAAGAVFPPAAAVLAAGAALVAAAALPARKALRHAGDAEQEARDGIATRVVDVLGATREVLSHDLVPAVAEDVAAGTARAARVGRRRTMLEEAASAVRDLAVTGVVVGVIAASGAAVARGVLEPAWLPALMAACLAGVAATADAAATLTRLHPLTASARRVADGLHRPPVVAPTAPTRTRSLPPGPLGLRFRAVDFAYDDAVPALSGWSAEVRPGERVGLAGPSGAGKSTVLALAARLWDPAAGAVELVDAHGNAVDVRDVADAELRDAVAFVDQDSTVFHGTVRENLLRGGIQADDDALRAALRRVHADDDWADLDAPLGESGAVLSGGQRARVALARALVRRPRVLLADEVTAALDPETERIVADVLAEYDGTVLTVSHRAATLARLDRVMTLD